MPEEPESSPAGPVRPTGAPPQGDGDRRRQHQREDRRTWKVPFVLFVVGFALLVVLAKINLPPAAGNILKGLGAGLCVGALIIVRRRFRKSRGAKPPESR